MSSIGIIFLVAVFLNFITGFYSLLFTRNLIRILISLEVLNKSMTLLLVIVGHATGDIGKLQAFIITLIVIEVIVIAIAAGLVLGIFRKNNSLDTRFIRKLKG